MEILECIPVIYPHGNNRAEYRREGMTGTPSQSAQLSCSLVSDQRLADVKYDRVNHSGILWLNTRVMGFRGITGLVFRFGL